MTVKSRPGLTRARRLFKFESTIRHPDSESSQSLLPCRRGCHCHVERRAAVEVGPAAAARNELTRRLRRYTAATFPSATRSGVRTRTRSSSDSDYAIQECRTRRAQSAALVYGTPWAEMALTSGAVACASPKPCCCAENIAVRTCPPRPISRLSRQHFLKYSRIFRHCIAGFKFEASFWMGGCPRIWGWTG